MPARIRRELFLDWRLGEHGRRIAAGREPAETGRAKRRACLAAAVLALSNPDIDEALTAWRNEQTAKVADYPKDE